MQIKCIFNTEVNSIYQFFTKICYIICPSLFVYIEVPQFIIQQRVDQVYDGGKPIWSKPAVVYVSGSVASVGVIILGIRKLYPYVKVSELTFPWASLTKRCVSFYKKATILTVQLVIAIGKGLSEIMAFTADWPTSEFFLRLKFFGRFTANV